MSIVTRQTTSTGVVNKGAPLTNSELDNNFIILYNGDLNQLTIKNNATFGTADTHFIQLNGKNITSPNGLAINTNQLTVQKTTGNVGIGTNAPTEKLHVLGNAKIKDNLTVEGNVVLGNAIGKSIEIKGKISGTVNGSDDAALKGFVIDGSTNTVKVKFKTTAGAPAPEELIPGELLLNMVDKKIYYKHGNAIKSIG